MSLIKCYECKKDVSTEAKQCPNCGAPVHALSEFLNCSEDTNINWDEVGSKIFLISLIIVALMWWEFSSLKATMPFNVLIIWEILSAIFAVGIVSITTYLLHKKGKNVQNIGVAGVASLAIGGVAFFMPLILMSFLSPLAFIFSSVEIAKGRRDLGIVAMIVSIVELLIVLVTFQSCSNSLKLIL